MTDSITNKHGTEIRVGSVWADNDWRSEGRTIRVVALEEPSHVLLHARRAVCEVLTEPGGKPPSRSRKVRIQVDRMHPTSTGYRLVHEGR
ncbi:MULTISPECIES: hypothetical protein [Nocardia]|uniref:hypothetical protein n=1 Tax=Nocardia TaxID=1817 RepID=UPI0024584A79|nr:MULTISPECIES: hypothetical protein [Nocardia]